MQSKGKQTKRPGALRARRTCRRRAGPARTPARRGRRPRPATGPGARPTSACATTTGPGRCCSTASASARSSCSASARARKGWGKLRQMVCDSWQKAKEGKRKTHMRPGSVERAKRLAHAPELADVVRRARPKLVRTREVLDGRLGALLLALELTRRRPPGVDLRQVVGARAVGRRRRVRQRRRRRHGVVQALLARAHVQRLLGLGRERRPGRRGRLRGRHLPGRRAHALTARTANRNVQRRRPRRCDRRRLGHARERRCLRATWRVGRPSSAGPRRDLDRASGAGGASRLANVA